MKKQFFFALFLSLNLVNLFGMEEQRPEETLSAEEIKLKAYQTQLEMQLDQMRFEINSKSEQLQNLKTPLIKILKSKIKPNFKISKNLKIRTLLIFAEEIRILCSPKEREQLESIGTTFRNYRKLVRNYKIFKQKTCLIDKNKQITSTLTASSENLPGFFQEYEESQNLLSPFIIRDAKIKTPDSKIKITNLNIFRHALTDEIKQRINTLIRMDIENRENLAKQREEALAKHRENLAKQREETLFLERFQKNLEEDHTYYLE